ncbi:MAG TPA: hypothetical protein PLP76_06940, partial [Bacteroidales bacterium]|nr:hypothetical protein [Bacteroidales bacterium]
PIINGKRFFEYVDFYITQREKLFDFNKEDTIKAEIPEFVEFYENYCRNYSGAGRSGDKKVKNFYENILIAFIDKFGFVGDFKNYYEAFYKLAYYIRCENQRITSETILKSSALQVFREINDAVTPDALRTYQYKTYKIENNKLVKGIGRIANFIDGFYDKLKKELTEQGLTIEDQKDYPNYYLIPCKFLNHSIYIFIGDKDNPYWYGFGGQEHYKHLCEDITKLEENIHELNLQKTDKSWFGWNEFDSRNKTAEIVCEIKKWIEKLNNQS